MSVNFRGNTVDIEETNGTLCISQVIHGKVQEVYLHDSTDFELLYAALTPLLSRQYEEEATLIHTIGD